MRRKLHWCIRSNVQTRPVLCAGRMFLEKKAEELITVLLATAEGSKCADIRIAALECLGVVMTLPYNLLHPNVRRVCQNLTKALDDPKRAVRMQAAKTRRLWNPT